MREAAARRVVVVIRAGARAREVRRWLRALLPTAVLVASPGALPAGEGCDVVTIDADQADAGPLSLATAIARGLRSRPPGEAAAAPLPPSGR